jgi:endonuclease/exonuclease/phosphatase (EEP) superfamily protein YafD
MVHNLPLQEATMRTDETAPRRGRFLLRAVALLYLLALLVLLGLVYGPGEGLWPITVFLFGPRLLVALPLLVLALVAALVDRPLLGLLVLVGLGLAGPLFGFNVPWRGLVSGGHDASAPALRLITWNVGTAGLEARELEHLLTRERPDVVVLQECHAEVMDVAGEWHRHFNGKMCLLSRFPVLEVAVRDRSDMWARAGSGAILRYALETPAGRVDLTHVHLETPREGLEELLGSGLAGVETLRAKNRQREIEARLARAWAAASPGPLHLVAGDFNTPVESSLFREYWRGFRDCHSEAGWGFGFTKRTRRIGARIDHILAGPGWRCLDTRVVAGMDGDHAPLVALVAATPATSATPR